jgi:hypothetical protein
MNLTKDLQISAKKSIDPIIEELAEQAFLIRSNRIMISIATNNIEREEFSKKLQKKSTI